MIRFLLPLAIFAAIVGFLAKGLWLDPREVPSPLIGKPAPEFRIEKLDAPGQQIAKADLLGKVYLLNAWASWCVACREEHPFLVASARADGVTIYGLNYKDTRADGERWLSQLGNPYVASLYDPDGKLGIDFGVYAVPETFLIDKLGVVRFKQIGPITPEVWQQKILPLVRRLGA